MIAKELMGCRVCSISIPTEIIGKIVGLYMKGTYHTPTLMVLTPKGIFEERSPEHVVIFKDDIKKMYNVIQPDPIRSRAEILDL